MKSCRAFTLIELLTVVGIIGMLMACVLAALPTARDMMLGSKCASNLRTLSQSLLLYTQDHDQTFPAAETATYGQPKGIWFDYKDLVLPYLGLTSSTNSPVFTCPLDHEFAPANPSYIFNGANQYDPNFKGLAGKRANVVAEPGKTLLLTEGAAIYPRSWHSGRNRATENNARSYAAFVDGHVAFLAFYSGGGTFSAGVNPPESYDYKWGE